MRLLMEKNLWTKVLLSFERKNKTEDMVDTLLKMQYSLKAVLKPLKIFFKNLLLEKIFQIVKMKIMKLQNNKPMKSILQLI